MKSVGKWSGVGIAVLVLSGCATGDAGSSGAIEVAVTTTCTEGASPDCVAVNGEHVIVADDAFETVGVKTVTASESQADGAVDLELTDDGAAVLTATTTEASGAGADARLLIRVGGDVVSAVTVAEPLEDDHVEIALPAEMDKAEFTEKVRQS